MTARARQKRPAAIRMVMPFVFRHWLKQPAAPLIVAGGLLGATVADLFMPLFSGHLVDALTPWRRPIPPRATPRSRRSAPSSRSAWSR